MAYRDLSLRERHAIIKAGVANGVYNLSDIEERYNNFTDPAKNLDYDMEGYVRENPNAVFGHEEHYPDTYKMPNHPSFSEESIYSTPQTPGGRWEGNAYEPSGFVLNQQGGWNNFLKGFYNQEQGTGAVPVFNGGVMLPEIEVRPSPKYKKSSEAYYDPETDTIFAPDSTGEFYTHERFHARPNKEYLQKIAPYYENLNDSVLTSMGADLPFINRNGDPGQYYSPEEIGARVAASLEMLKKAGVSKIDSNFVKESRKNELKYGDNYRDLLHMYNDDIITNMLNSYANGGSIHIAPSKRGTFTAAATKHGKSVQAFASQVLAHKENYSPAMVKKANFARNAAHWHDGNSDTQYLNTEVYEPWFPDKRKEEYGFNIGQWLGPMHVREMQLGSARNHSEASSYLVDSNKEFVNDYISRLSAAHPELSSTALSDIKASLSPESISFVPDDAFTKSNSAGETVAHREGNKIVPEIRLRDNIGYYDTPNKYRDLSNIFRHEMNHFLRKYQGNYTDSIFNQDERGILNSAYFAVPSTLERAAENARLRSIISQNHDNVWGKELDDVIDNLSYEDLLSYISNMEGYMKDSEPLYTAPDKEAVAGLQSKIAEKDKERDAILNTVIYPKYLIPYEDGTYIKDNIINKYKTIEGEDASGVRDAMFKEWDENTDLKRVDSERKALEEELKKVLMAPNKERLDAVKTALKQVAQNNSGFQKSNNTYLAAFGGHLVHQHGFGDWLNRVFGSQESVQTADTIPQEPLTQGLDYKELRQRQAYTESKFDNNAKSPAGAVGIFQVTPNVLSDYNKANKTEYKVEDLTDQAINSAVRDWQMQALMQRPWVTAGGANDSIQFAKALSGYNWGSTNTVNTLNKAKADGVDIYNGWEWLSYLPKETQDYINFILRGQDNSIMRNDSAYHARIKARPDEVTLLNEMKTGGPLYPFSFSKRGIPPVRH